MRVVVAGAGLAGLSAAHELARAGAAVTVLESRDRVGGRVWTVRDGFRHGQHGELGGEFIDEGHRHMRALAQRYGLETVPVLGRGFTHRYRLGAGIEVSRTRPWDELRHALSPLIDRYNTAQGDQRAAVVRELSTYSVSDWLRHQGADPELHAMAVLLRGFFLADPEEISVLAPVQQLAEGGSPAQVTMFRIVGGNDRLLEALVRDTPARMLLRHHLQAIDQAADRLVARVTDDTGRLQELDADAIVVALPASTLRDVSIRPALPEAQQRAINALCYGRATKVVVQCAGDGLSRRRARAFATDGGLGAFWDATEGQPSDGSSTITFLGGGAASPQLRDRAQAGAAALLSPLCWLGVAGAATTAMQTVTWEDDPLARGGYAFFDPGFDSSWRPLLARPAGRVVFAGEHTSEDFQGYMEGAVESGLRAAGELRGRIG